MAGIVGPFDKRRLRTRCAACRTLHLKCEGGHPCYGCISSGRSCKFEIAARRPVYFRNAAYDDSRSTSYYHSLRVISCQNETFIWHFFSSFLPRNNFTARRSDEQQLLRTYIHKSDGLRNAVIAIGALDLSRHVDHSSTAATHYKQAVSSLRLRLSLGTDVDHATLWTSLLLAIFELMFDTTGAGFMVHFTKGLPALIRRRNLNRSETSHCQTLLHIIPMLEVMRSAPFWSNKEPTLLEDTRWQQTIQHAAGESPEAQAFIALYSLMRHFLKLNNTIYAIVLSVTPEDMTLEDRQHLRFTAEEGRSLCRQLETWYTEHIGCTKTPTSLSLLSSIYHRALAISMTAVFKSAHFTYCRLSVPDFSVACMDSRQVDELCMLLRCALCTTNLAGVLVLWPLRVAGSNSISKDQVRDVLEMVREIRQRGFAVARSFEAVLMEQWKQKFLL